MGIFVVKNAAGHVDQVDENNIPQAEKDGYSIVVSNGDHEDNVSYNDLPKAIKDGYKPVKEDYDYSNLPKDLAQSTVDALPVYGQAAGSMFGPIGAGLGQAAGNSLKQGINSTVDSLKKGTFIDDNMRLPTGDQVAKIADETIGQFNEGVVYDAAGQIVGKAAGALAKVNKGMGQAGGGFKTATAEGTQSVEATAKGNAKASASFEGGGATIEQTGQILETKAPKNLDELKSWNPGPNAGELPQKGRLEEIETVLPEMQTKHMKYHKDMLENPKSMQKLKLDFENLPTESAMKQAQYNQEIVNESGRGAQSVVKSISSSEPQSIGDAGENFLTALKDKYHDTKTDLSPVFKAIKQDAQSLSKADSAELIKTLGGETKIGSLIEEKAINITPENPKGIIKVSLKKNTPKSGLTDQEHDLISRVIDDLNDGMTYEELQRTREFLRNSVDPANPKATQEVVKVRQILLKKLGTMADKEGGEVATAMKNYAINEQGKESIEKIIGGKIENLNKMYAANPEKIVSKIFANPNHAAIVTEFMGKDVVDQMAQAYVAKGVAKSFDSVNGFQPVAMRQWIKTNESFLKNYVSPEVAQKLSAWADSGYLGKRYLDAVNPSGTAASLEAMFKPGSFATKVRTQGVKGAVFSEIEQALTSKVKQNQAIKAVNESMGTPPPAPGQSVLRAGAKNEMQLLKDPNSVEKLTKQAVSTGLTSVGNRPEKGPERWAFDGAQKLRDLKIDESIIEQVRKSPNGNQILIDASVATPKELQQIIEKIKTQYKPTKPAVQEKFPKVVKKDGFTAVVSTAFELSEARSEGWT